MTVSHRPMEPKDVRECAAIIAQHPVIGPRYGGSIGDLPKALLRLLGYEAKRATVYHTTDGPRAPICFVGVSVFVSDAFVRELKAPPGMWIGQELVKWIVRGDSPILSDSEFREANSRGGLNLLVWEGCSGRGFENSRDLHTQVMNTFLEEHAGFLLNEVITPQVESEERLRWALQSGCMLWNPLIGRYEESFKKTPKEIIKKPHLVGITRKIELERLDTPITWVGALFDYHRPQCGFSPSEQRMLLVALEGGGTDRELSRKLSVSVSTVKKMWLSAYRRMADRLPRPDLNQSQPDGPMIQRGAEKKRHLLAYLRKHPEELRPSYVRAPRAILT